MFIFSMVIDFTEEYCNTYTIFTALPLIYEIQYFTALLTDTQTEMSAEYSTRFVEYSAIEEELVSAPGDGSMGVSRARCMNIEIKKECSSDPSLGNSKTSSDVHKVSIPINFPGRILSRYRSKSIFLDRV